MVTRETRSMLALSLVPKLGQQRIRNLIQHVNHPEELFSKPLDELLSIDGIGQTTADSILQFNSWDLVDKLIHRAEQVGSTAISLLDDEYPNRLKQIYDSPLVLWIKGDVESLETQGIAIVGTRNPTPYGQKMATLFTRNAVQKGLSVFSGLAYGVDTIAHRVCVESGGKTVAVLGSGIDWIYPAANKKLADKIVESGGAIITEFVPGTKPDAGNFPTRNRIVSGLSLGVLVVETSEKGGSRITANIALDQGREVFVVPHPIDNPHGTGCNELIKKGYGKLVQDFEDIEEEIQWERPVLQENQPEKNSAEVDVSGLSEPLQEIVLCIQRGVNQIDELAEKLEMSTQDMLVRLLELEFRGVIVQRAGKQFYLARI
ncbi:DNA-protecting protein DprA [bacterium]|nr:MAG: DNA-protecting protein DprA [bacterium]